MSFYTVEEIFSSRWTSSLVIQTINNARLDTKEMIDNAIQGTEAFHLIKSRKFQEDNRWLKMNSWKNQSITKYFLQNRKNLTQTMQRIFSMKMVLAIWELFDSFT